MFWTCNGLHRIFTYILSKCRCSSPFGNRMSCSLLTPQLCSCNCFSFGNVICGICCLYSPCCLSYGDVIYGTVGVYLTTYTTSGTTLTTIGIANGSILPLIIFYAFKFVLSYSLFILQPKAPPSSTLFFLLKTFLGKSTTIFFLFFNALSISSLVLLTLASGLCGLSF